jgi:hypothetical protein
VESLHSPQLESNDAQNSLDRSLLNDTADAPPGRAVRHTGKQVSEIGMAEDENGQ